MGSRRVWNSLLANSDLAPRGYAATLLSLLQHMACSRAWGLSVFYAELKQGNCGVRNVFCPAVHFPEERRPRTKSSCAEAVLCDMPKSRAVMALLCAQRVTGMGKRKAQSLLLSLTKRSALMFVRFVALEVH